MSETNPKDVWAQAHDRLRSMESSHRLRRERTCDIPENKPGANRSVDGKKVINFCSNDYLDLAHNPDVKQGAIDAVKKYGSGCMASRLICGTLPIHRELEDELAKFKRVESVLVFSSGYLACQGVIQSLSLRGDNSSVPIIFDRLSHSSLIDGATQNRRNWRSFPHNDVPSLEMLLKRSMAKEWPSAVVVTEGVFSMDGDIAPLKTLSELCAEYRAILLVDDAHGTGVMGEHGRGSTEVAGITGEAHVVQVGTLSKALGSQGGFVAGPEVLRKLLVNTARTFIFDTGLNPAAAGAALAALRIMQQEPERREKLQDNISLLRTLLNRIGCDKENPSPIIPILLEDEKHALSASESLCNDGYFVAAIRPPTVPQGTSRLRITLSSAHEERDIRNLAKAITTLETA